MLKESAARLTEAEYNERNHYVLTKLHSGEKLSAEEKYFLCDCRHTHRLLMLPMCNDEFFIRFYLNRSGPPYIDRFEERHWEYFRMFVADWKREIEKENHKEQLLYWSAVETKREIKAHRAANTVTKDGLLLENHVRQQFETYAWSRYQYLTLKRILLEELKGKPYLLTLNGQEIRYDEFSMVHTITRHFAEGLKQYNSRKDHFHGDFYPNQLHLQLEAVLNKIDQSGLYQGQSIQEVSFRFNGLVYRLYCKSIQLQEKGKAARQAWRLNTFFPVGEQELLDELKDGYIEHSITTELSVFVKKAASQ